jgi:hypothetical protein
MSMPVNARERGQKPLSPAEYCRNALNAIEVSERRRRKRKRDTGPDLTGMDMKRELLELAIEERPGPEEFEGWLLNRVMQASAGGPLRAMAMEILADYQNARQFQEFNSWLDEGAPTPQMGERRGR